jgi:hypothetical protein
VAYDVTSSIGRGHISKCVQYNYEKLKPARALRSQLIKKQAGALFSGAKLPSPFALMLQAAEAHVMGIAANRPRVSIVAKKLEYVAFAKHYQEALNALLKEIRIEQTLQAIALDSFFGPAFGKVYLGDSPVVLQEADIWMDPGQAYFDRLSLDDFIYDTLAKDFRKCVIMADKYRLPLWMVKDDKTRFKQSVAEKLQPVKDRGSEEAESAEWIGKELEEPIVEGDYEPMIDLIDVFLPREKKIFTWALDPGWRIQDTEPLSVQKWDGAETGPYHYLNMGPVPDNVLPTSPAQNILWLTDLADSLGRKSARQAERMKSVTVYRKGANDDAEAIKRAKDGEQLFLDDIENGVEKRYGGADNNLTSYLTGVIGLTDRFAGNLQTRLGLGPSSDTVGQDQMIHQNVSRNEAGMQSKFMRFVTEVCEAIGPLLFDDPAKTIPVTVRVGDAELPDEWRPATEYGERQGKANDYDLCIEPYSMAYQSPNQRANTLQNAVMYLAQVAPGFAAMQQLGVQVDVDELIEIMSEYQNVPELKRVFQTGRLPDPMQQESQSQGTVPFTGNKPNGQYTRRNVTDGDSPEAAFAKMTPNKPQEEAA